VTGAALRPGETPGIGYAVARAAALRGHAVALLDVSARGLAGAEAALRAEFAPPAGDVPPAGIALPVGDAPPGAAALAAGVALSLAVGLPAGDAPRPSGTPPGVGLNCRVARADIGDAAAVTAAVAALGPVTAVVTAAALTRTARSFVPFLDLEPADIDAAVAVNVSGLFNVVRAVVPGFLAARRGVVITIGSAAASYPASGLALYAMTKAAVASVTRSLAAEYGSRGIHVQGFAPGPVRTAVYARTPEHYRRSTAENSVTGRPAEPGEIADEIVAAIEHPQPLLAGHMVPLDGGLSPFGVHRATEPRSPQGA